MGVIKLFLFKWEMYGRPKTTNKETTEEIQA